MVEIILYWNQGIATNGGKRLKRARCSKEQPLYACAEVPIQAFRLTLIRNSYGLLESFSQSYRDGACG